jgi:hypothetical protein
MRRQALRFVDLLVTVFVIACFRAKCHQFRQQIRDFRHQQEAVVEIP